jgi:hypothetical protein
MPARFAPRDWSNPQLGGGIEAGPAPQKMLLSIENGESSSSNDPSGEVCADSAPIVVACPMLCMAAKLASESVDIVLAPADTDGLGGAANLDSASTERARGADISLGSMFKTTSVINVDSRVNKFCIRALRCASPSIPSSKAELRAR